MNFQELISVPPTNSFNIGLVSPSNTTMDSYFGQPVLEKRYDPTGNSTPITNQEFAKRIATRSVGPFKVTGQKPALDSMTAILTRVKAELPELYSILGTEGMLNVRLTKIRQKNGKIKVGPGISNHAWGTAVDITIGGKLDQQGNNTTQRGLLVLSSYFNAAGWYWGAAFPTEDAMHFEVSRSLLATWKKNGTI